MKIVSLEDLSMKLRGVVPPRLVEALPAKYFDAGHLPGAVNMNHVDVTQKAAWLLPDRGAEIIVYCSGPSCNNSHKAATQLLMLGYQNVAVFSGGKADWQAAGFALEM